MCGISGIYVTKQGRPEFDVKQLISIMNTTLAHRGPDDEGFWATKDTRCALGQRRLSILDLSSAGHQPMIAQHCTISFNGEIFNHLQLRKQYLKEYSFVSHTDTETLLALYLKYGESCLEFLNGMYAFAIWEQ